MNNLELNKIYCESNLETMARMPDGYVDIILTSPPYNIIRPNSTDRGYDLYKDGIENDDYIKWTLDMFKEFNRTLSKNGIVLYNMSYGTENTILICSSELRPMKSRSNWS